MAIPRLQLSRRQWIQAATATTCGVAGGLLAESFVVAPQSLSQTHLHIGTSSLSDERSLRIVQLSDLHLRDIGQLEIQLLAAVTAAQPDVILLTGDTISHKNGMQPLSEFLEKLPPASHRLAIMGNWEYNAGLTPSSFRKFLRPFGFQVFMNESYRPNTMPACYRLLGLMISLQVIQSLFVQKRMTMWISTLYWHIVQGLVIFFRNFLRILRVSFSVAIRMGVRLLHVASLSLRLKGVGAMSLDGTATMDRQCTFHEASAPRFFLFDSVHHLSLLFLTGNSDNSIHK